MKLFDFFKKKLASNIKQSVIKITVPEITAPETIKPETEPKINVAILCYHAMNISGASYEQNDHIALEQDIIYLKNNGYNILPISKIVSALRNKDWQTLSNKVIGISFDDGSDYDYFDNNHPQAGLVKSFYNICEQQQICALGFIIASPIAREALTKNCGANWSDNWWGKSINSGVFELANHSWDHNHECVEVVAQRNQEKGNFYVIDTKEDADKQILDAQQYLTEKSAKFLPFFGYPYGHTNDYLINDYFPNEQHDIVAAFTTGGEFLTNATNPFDIPRFVCGWHWKTQSELINIINKL